jgi:hypothetical protein
MSIKLNILLGLVRFVPKSDSRKIFIGQPKDENLDVGLALYKGQEVLVNIFSGTSVLFPGKELDLTDAIDQVLSPLSSEEVGTIRCIGLNVSSQGMLVYHADLTIM